MAVYKQLSEARNCEQSPLKIPFTSDRFIRFSPIFPPVVDGRGGGRGGGGKKVGQSVSSFCPQFHLLRSRSLCNGSSTSGKLVDSKENAITRQRFMKNEARCFLKFYGIMTCCKIFFQYSISIPLLLLLLFFNCSKRKTITIVRFLLCFDENEERNKNVDAIHNSIHIFVNVFKISIGFI